MEQAFQREVDLRGFKCPIPILKTKKILAEMISGEILKVQATDIGALRDFQAFSKQTGNILISHQEEEGYFTFYMQRK